MKKLSLSIITLLLFQILISGCAKEQSQVITPVIVIHGGAGTITPETMDSQKVKSYEAALTEALVTGYEILSNGGSSLDAVEKTINVMEDNPLFNSGKGAVFNDRGEFELDASIMRGDNLQAGAAAGVRRTKNPISLARLVMEKSPHVLLAGKGADLFAEKNGLETVDNSYFRTPERKAQWQKIEQERAKIKAEEQEKEKEHGDKFGTVGCVALDKNGNLAAGTSTGGMSLKKFGRVGDSPIIGAGTYADNATCAVSCTGHGEYFIRYAVAYDISALMKYKNYSLKNAAREVIMNKLKKAGGSGGIIAVDRNGNIVLIFNTKGMFRGYMKEKGKPVVKMFGDKLSN